MSSAITPCAAGPRSTRRDVGDLIDVVVAALSDLDPAHYGAFVRGNPAFIATTRRRVISYWDCYHRRRSPRLEDYPGLVALTAIERMA